MAPPALTMGLQGISAEGGPRTYSAGFRLLEGVFEPSGVVQLADGRLLVAEDGAAHPFVLLRPAASGARFGVVPLRPPSLLAGKLLRLDDVEGLAIAPGDRIYAITSHSRRANGKRDAAREQLLRFAVDGDRMSALGRPIGLRDALSAAFPELDEAAKERDANSDHGLSIEGLSYDPRDRRLWVGLRGPVVDDMAILVSIVEPLAAFEAGGRLMFGSEPVLLDLDSGGIRGLNYVPRLDGFLVLSQEGTKKGNRPFKLWLWLGDPGTSPQRVRIAGLDDLERTESVFPVRLGSEERLLLMSDAGDAARGQAAHYALVDYSRLTIEPPATGR